jgi:HK97 gp10 family phage protein
MVADGISVKLEGIDELKRALASLPAKIRVKAIRSALRDAAKVIQKDARGRAPVLATATPRRRPGTIKRRIMVRNSKVARQRGDEGVFVSVKPLTRGDAKKLGKRGSTNPNDPYYWWWQEFGYRPRGKKAAAVPGKKFLTTAAQSKGAEAIATFMRQAIPRINALNNAVAKRGA